MSWNFKRKAVYVFETYVCNCRCPRMNAKPRLSCTGAVALLFRMAPPRPTAPPAIIIILSRCFCISPFSNCGCSVAPRHLLLKAESSQISVLVTIQVDAGCNPTRRRPPHGV